jgi:meiotic recombination protein SPO11
MPPRRKRASSADVAAAAAAKKKAHIIADDADEVLNKCRELKAKLRADMAAAPSSPSKLSADEKITEVAELTIDQVMEGMECIAIKIAQQVMHKQGFSMEIPSRAGSNQVYVKEWDRIVLGSKTSTRSFLNVKVRGAVCVYCTRYYDRS